MTERICCKCKELKDISLFSKDCSRPDGVRPYCRACHSTQTLKERRANPVKAKNWVQTWRHNNPEHRSNTDALWTMNNPEKSILLKIRGRARKIGIPFDLELSDIVIPEVCPILGIPFRVNFKNKIAFYDSMSIDRVDPKLGYVKGNVRIISMKANSVKNNATLEELRMIVKYVKSHQKS